MGLASRRRPIPQGIADAAKELTQGVQLVRRDEGQDILNVARVQRKDSLDQLAAFAGQDDAHHAPVAFVILPTRQAVAFEPVHESRSGFPT